MFVARDNLPTRSSTADYRPPKEIFFFLPEELPSDGHVLDEYHQPVPTGTTPSEAIHTTTTQGDHYAFSVSDADFSRPSEAQSVEHPPFPSSPDASTLLGAVGSGLGGSASGFGGNTGAPNLHQGTDLNSSTGSGRVDQAGEEAIRRETGDRLC